MVSGKDSFQTRQLNAATKPQRFASLDVLRGLASLSIVFWHWQHFYIGLHADSSIESQPLYNAFYLFYRRGELAVDLFFMISGFIFFWLYSESIASGRVSGYRFFILRFSRLYPLHFLTLLVVTLLQTLSLLTGGGFVVYSFNDFYHFALNLLFASSWGFEKGFSFNAPSWSVSVEILLYILFFLLSLVISKKPLRRMMILLAILMGVFLLKPYLPGGIVRGLFSFFTGGLLLLLAQVLNHRASSLTVIVLGAVTILLWTLAFMEFRVDFTLKLSERALFSGILSGPYRLLVKYYSVLLLFPMTILFLSVWEATHGFKGGRLALLGDISYSSYLLHFPLQLVFILVSRWMGVPAYFYYSGFSLVLFFGVLIPLAFVTYHFVERPLQNWIRAALLTQ